jgi:hypothetical protein
MFQIVCIEESTKRPSTIATGFRDEIEARRTVQNWIDRRFVDAAYDHGRECWWLLDDGRAYRIFVKNTSPESRQKSLKRFGASAV